MIDTLLQQAVLFAGFTEEERSLIIQHMRMQHFAAQENIYSEGDESSALYLLEKGGVRLQVGRMALATLGPGATFGEADVFLQHPRAASVVATTDSDVWALAASDLEKLVLEMPSIGIKLSRNFGSPIAQLQTYLVSKRLRNIPAFKALTDEELALLASRLEMENVGAGEALYQQGEAADVFILETGGVVLQDGDGIRVFAGDATAINEIGAIDILSFSDLRMMDKALKDARCPKTTKLIDGSTKYGTTTVGKARYVYVGQEALPTLEDMEHNGKSVWSPVEDYAAAGTVAEGEIGRIGPFRFIEVEDMPRYVGIGADATDSVDDDDAGNRYTSDDETGTAHYDVFPILFVGSNSFATVGFEGDVARVTTVMPKADAYNDPYGKKGSVSISWYYGIMFLQESWIRQISCSLKVA